MSNSTPIVGVSSRNVTLATDALALLTDLATRVVDALDAGPGAIDPQIAATIAVATPLLALLCCLCLCLVCRCTRRRWRMAAACGGGALFLPRSGTEPDRALESHEDELDELDEVDSVDEPVRLTPPPFTDGEDEEAGDEPGSPASAMRACCSSIADAIAACPDEATTASAPASAPSAPAPAKPKPRAKGSGHVRTASVGAR